MIRKIVDYQKLNERLLDLLTEKYPDGYDDQDIISFKNAQNEWIEAVEIRTEDTVYLVKVGKRLVKAMEEYNDENETPKRNKRDLDSEDTIDDDDDENYDNDEENGYD